jgi:ABC-type transport system involved in multi-copper enzyme maturation permease subunit
MLYQSVNFQGIQPMKKLIVLFLSLGVIVLAIIGTLYIFDFRTADQSLEMLVQIEGGILLLAVCSAAISLLVGIAKKDSQE